MNDFINDLKKIIKFIFKLFISMFITLTIVSQPSSKDGNNGLYALLVIALTILIYYFLSNIRNVNMYKKFYSILLEIFFHKQRKEGKQLLYDYCNKKLADNAEDGELFKLSSEVSKSNKLCFYEIEEFLHQTLNKLVDDNIEKNVEPMTMVGNVSSMNSGFNSLDFGDILLKLGRYYVEEQLLAGKLPYFYGNCDKFNLQKDEKPVYVEPGVSLYKWKNQKYYTGSSSGYSFRIAKGFWIRESAYRGKPIEYKSLEYADFGKLLITNKHIYYSGEYEIFRIPFEKIVSIDPRPNGLTIQKDGVSSKPMIFKFGETLFVYEIVKLLSQNDISEIGQ